eukprot:COSAG01_NODE_1846_length_9050_cov_10.563991_4_plen_87_part_00
MSHYIHFNCRTEEVVQRRFSGAKAATAFSNLDIVPSKKQVDIDSPLAASVITSPSTKLYGGGCAAVVYYLIYIAGVHQKERRARVT